jgi:hypothetical protein
MSGAASDEVAELRRELHQLSALLVELSQLHSETVLYLIRKEWAHSSSTDQSGHVFATDPVTELKGIGNDTITTWKAALEQLQRLELKLEPERHG